MSCTRPRLSLTVSTLAVTVALGALLLSGQSTLELPPLTAPADWQRWLTGREPADAFVALVRLGALLSCWYVLAATTAGVFARAVGARPLIRLADAVSPRSLRAIVRWALGAGLATSTLTASPALAARAPSPVITMTRLPDPANPGTAPTAVPAGRVVPAGTAVPAVAPPPSPVVATWEVRPGQSLWKIARDVESLRRGRVATDREVCAYWRSLIEANRDLLADPRNPHLVFTGQVFRLPPLPRP
jgi:hypothetical protein